MKQISLIILLFASIFHTAHAMEKENEKEKLKPIASIVQSIKTFPKKVVASFTKKQPKVPTVITEKSRIEGSGKACVQAIKDNNPEDLALELLLGANVNYIHDGKSLFYIACEEWDKGYRDTEIIKILITHENIDVSSRNPQKITPLHIACQFGLTATVASMLQRAPQAVYLTDKLGCTPLHAAVFYKKKDCMELILSYNINIIDHQDYTGNTPLHLACVTTQLDLITLLIQKGACTTIQNHKKQTPLYILFCSSSYEYCQQFLNHCTPDITHQLVHAKDHNNNTQLHLCATMSTEDHAESTLHQYFLPFLIAQKNIDITTQNNDNKTALDFAYETYKELQQLYQTEQLPYIAQALRNQENILMNFLIAEGKMEIKKRSYYAHINQSPNNNIHYKDLYEAQHKCLKGVEECNLSLVKEGLSEGADLNFITTPTGSPLLSQACSHTTKVIIQELLKYPINLKAIHARSGDTALHAACKANRPAIVALLLQKDRTLATIASMDGTTPFDIAMVLEDTGCLDKILQYNRQAANIINEHNETPLYVAVEKQNNKQIELLLNANNNNINHQDDNRDTVLHKACECTSYTKEICDIIKLLIIHGADTTIKNGNQATPLINLFADISQNEFKIVDFLLAEHPDIFDIFIHTKDKHDNTQFHLCTQLQNLNDNFEHYLHLLKSNKLDIRAKNKDGKTAVDLAGEIYNKLYHRYAAQRLPYFKQAFDMQERVYHTFLRATALPTSCASFKQIFKQKSADGYEFPPELIQHIMRGYYDLNIETIIAKKYANNKEYYDDFIENKQDIREQLHTKPEPRLLWNK